jgi:hypothetical protein
LWANPRQAAGDFFRYARDRLAGFGRRKIRPKPEIRPASSVVPRNEAVLARIYALKLHDLGTRPKYIILFNDL